MRGNDAVNIKQPARTPVALMVSCSALCKASNHEGVAPHPPNKKGGDRSPPSQLHNSKAYSPSVTTWLNAPSGAFVMAGFSGDTADNSVSTVC